MTGSTPTATMSGWSRSLRFDDLPEAVLTKVLDHTLDTLGAIVVGADKPWTLRVRDYANAESPDGDCTVIGAKRSLRPEWAALVNGTAAHGYEIDDYAVPGLSHPGSVVVPTVLALAEELQLGGRETIAALAAGLETVVRFGAACSPSLTFDRGFHVTSALGVFGAAAASINSYGVNEAVASHAFALAAAHACGSTEFTRTGGDVKRLHAGMAAAAGIRSTALARRGFTGPSAAIEGERGFMHSFVARPRIGALTDGLGTRWELNGLAMKRWCVCAGIQAPLVAMMELKALGVSADSIAGIEVGVDAVTSAHVGKIGGRPKDFTSAQMSLHHAIGMSLVAGGNDPIHYARYETDQVLSESISRMGERVSVVVNEEADIAFPHRLTTRIRVSMLDGSIIKLGADAPGTGGYPVGSHTYADKFLTLTEPTLGESRSKAIGNAVHALQDGMRPTELMALLAVKERP
jgi:2-methylcitrate dehydratase PrpD